MLVSKTNGYRANPSREQDESVECPTCRKRLSSRSILIRHLCETHQTNLHQEPINIRTFRCLEAGCKSGPFKRKSQLCSHKQTKHNYGPKDSGKGELHSTSNSESFQQDPEHPHLPIFEKEAQEVGQDSVKLYSLAPKPANSKNREKFIQIPFLEVSDTELPNEGNGAAIIDQALPNANRSYSKLPQSSIEIDGFQDNFLENYAEPNFIDSIPGISTTQNLLLLSSKTGLNRDNRIPPDYSLKDSNGEFNLFFDQKDEMPESDLFSSMGSAGLSKPKSHFRFEVSFPIIFLDLYTPFTAENANTLSKAN